MEDITTHVVFEIINGIKCPFHAQIPIEDIEDIQKLGRDNRLKVPYGDQIVKVARISLEGYSDYLTQKPWVISFDTADDVVTFEIVRVGKDSFYGLCGCTYLDLNKNSKIIKINLAESKEGV